MEQDYNIKHWAKPCPKYDCRKDSCKCGMKFVSIPAVLGDDSSESDVAPKNGLYCNTIVRYEANGHVYLYSSDGIPVLMPGGTCHCLPNLVIELPRGITEYARGEAPISYDDIEEAFEQGRSIFFLDKTFEAEYSIYTVTAFDNTDGIRTIKVEKTGINPYTDGDVGTWIIKSDHSDSWEDINFIPAISNKIIPLNIANAYNANWIIPDEGDFGMACPQGDVFSDNLTFNALSIGKNFTLEELFNKLEEGARFRINISSFSELAENEDIWDLRYDMGAAKVVIGDNKTVGMATKDGQNFNVEFYYGLAEVLVKQPMGEGILEFLTVPVGVGKIDNQYMFTTHIYGQDDM